MGSRNLPITGGLVAAGIMALIFAQIVQSSAGLGVAWWLSLGGSVIIVAGILVLAWWSQERVRSRDPTLSGLDTAQRRRAHWAAAGFVSVPDDPATRRAALGLVRRSIDQERRSRPLLWVAGASIVLVIVVGVVAIVTTHVSPAPMFYAVLLFPLLWLAIRQHGRKRLAELDADPNSAGAEG